MKKTFIFIAVVIGIILVRFVYREFLRPQPNEKVYVAVEGESKIVAVNPATNKLVSTVDLSVEHEQGWLPYAPHNVQVSPDMKTVWVTANSGKHQNHASRLVPFASAHGEEGEGYDEVVVINPKTDKIVQRIPIGDALHLAHVVLTPDSSFAFVTAQNEGSIYKINARTYEVEKKISVPPSPDPQEPHGLRISPDGLTAYVAMLKGKSLGILDLKTDTLSTIFLGGAAVQTGVTPDGQYVVASLYDTKQLAIYNIATKQINKVQLFQNAKGPVQMYATPDSKFIYLADQGYYFNQPTSEWVYKIDLQTFKVVKEIKAGQGPHGVAVSMDGARVYITNLISGDMSIINTMTDEEVGRVKVGKEPNGVSIWIK